MSDEFENTAPIMPPQDTDAKPPESPASSVVLTPDEALEAPEPAEAPGRVTVPVVNREGSDTSSGKNAFISWGARSDVGLVRTHNEDSFILRAPLFAVSDGMGGHAAGEIASSIAVETIARQAPAVADDTLLGAAVEEANRAVIQGAQEGRGKPGMGCTATAVLIEKNQMAVAHVGDSRAYLLHGGTLVRITHDHSFVGELVDAGELTADEARTHPSRSVITRALGSDEEMYADHFTLEVNNGDRIILCSDGLSSMVDDSQIESLAVSATNPQAAADNLVSAALTEGGSDNVSVVVIDILDDGIAAAHRREVLGRLARIGGALIAFLVLLAVGFGAIVRGSWYLADNEGTVAIYQGMNESFLGFELSELVDTTSVEVKDLPSPVQEQLSSGIRFSSEKDARAAVESYRDQIDADKQRAAQAAEDARADGDPTGETVNETSEIIESGGSPEADLPLENPSDASKDDASQENGGD